MHNYAMHQTAQFDALPNGGLFHRLWTNWKARAAVRRLEDLNDALLHDIGVTRAQVEMAGTMPLTRNAVLELQAFAAENRDYGCIPRNSGPATGLPRISPVRVC